MQLIIIGCILTYTSVIMLGLDSHLTSVESFPYICTARAWILMSGFTLSFGSMFSKTWRVHSIFTNVQLNKKVMKDYQLYLVVGALVTIDIITVGTQCAPSKHCSDYDLKCTYMRFSFTFLDDHLANCRPILQEDNIASAIREKTLV